MAAANHYEVGSLVEVTATFRDDAGALADPTAVVAEYKRPDGTIVVAAATHDSLGVYHIDVPLTESGNWAARFNGTGAIVAAAESKFIANATAFP